MKKLLFLLFLIPKLCWADGAMPAPLNIKTEDGSVNTYPYQLRVTNGTLTDNGDSTASLIIGSGFTNGTDTYYNGNFSTTQNSTANFYIGNGSLLTGLAGGGNANYNFGANNFSGTGEFNTTGNITAGFYIGNGSLLIGIAGGSGGYVGFVTNETIDINWTHKFNTTDNITANFFKGNGSLLTGLPTYVNESTLVGDTPTLDLTLGGSQITGAVLGAGLSGIPVANVTGALASTGTGTGLTALPWANITGVPIVFPITGQLAGVLIGNNSILNFNNGTGITWAIVNDTTGGRINITPTVSITQYTDALARASLSETITGIDYTSATGVFSITSGYLIPSSANETSWNNGATAYGWGNHASAGYAFINQVVNTTSGVTFNDLNLTVPLAITEGGIGAANLDNLIALTTNTTGNYVATVAGTANQIIVTGADAEGATKTFALPQPINTTSSPTFANVTATTYNATGGTGNSNLTNLTVSGFLNITSAGNSYFNGNLGVGGSNATTPLYVTGANDAVAATVFINANQTGVTASDTFIDFRSTTGSEASIAGTVVAGVIAYNTVTLSHYSQLIDRDIAQPNMLLEIIEGKPVFGEGASPKQQLFKTRICRTKKSQAAIGTYGGTDKYGHDFVLSGGTGFVFVKNTGRNIKIGDLFYSSDMIGCVELQSDDSLHSYTVAKATESIIWKKGEIRRLISCILLGG